MKINNVFWTFQGEGKHSGRRALFIRMPYCNLNCSWCDTSFDSYSDLSESDLISIATKESSRFAVITGGEPTMNKTTPDVINILKSVGFEIACESNGCFPVPEKIDFVTISPKREQKIHKPYYICDQAFNMANEFKYVVDDLFDFEILKSHNINDGRIYSLSPEFGNFEKNLDKIFNYIKENPKWKISLQTHKFMKIP